MAALGRGRSAERFGWDGVANAAARSVPVTILTTLRLVQREQMRRSRYSGRAVFAPYRSAVSAASGST
jgi:hypothetical protein